VTQRIRVVGGPWPERHGAEGHIAEPSPERARKYPFVGRGKNEVVIHLDSDPLSRQSPPSVATPLGRASWAQECALWTCVLDRTDVEFLP
jgi:hypothetical protein